jgi:peptide/nickel transport system substrate-binding protein
LAKQVQKFVLFTTLARYDEHLVAQPYLAREWRWSADGRRLVFSLAPEARWHDGTPTSAADVVWTVSRAREPATGYPRAADLAGVTAVRAIDTLTVEVTFAEPPGAFPDVLTDLAILPAHHFAGVQAAEIRAAPFNQAPVGNGPFRFVRHDPNRRWVFERDESFPPALGGPATLARLVIAIVDEPTTKLAALTSGELDVAGINPAHAEFVRGTDHLTVRDYPVLMTYLLVLNLRRPPFDDRRVREALALAVDRDAIVAAYLYGFATPAWGAIPPDHPAAAPARTLPYAPDSAARLLASAGFGSERPLEFELLTVSTGENALEQMLQAQLARAGVRVTLRPIELGAFLARAQSVSRDFDALVIGVPGDLALSHLVGLFDSRRLGEPLQYAGYANPALDRALDARRWGDVERLLVADRPVVFIYHARGVQGVTRRLARAVMDLRGELPTVTQWALAEGAP